MEQHDQQVHELTMVGGIKPYLFCTSFYSCIRVKLSLCIIDLFKNNIEDIRTLHNKTQNLVSLEHFQVALKKL